MGFVLMKMRNVLNGQLLVNARRIQHIWSGKMDMLELAGKVAKFAKRNYFALNPMLFSFSGMLAILWDFCVGNTYLKGQIYIEITTKFICLFLILW